MVMLGCLTAFLVRVLTDSETGVDGDEHLGCDSAQAPRVEKTYLEVDLQQRILDGDLQKPEQAPFALRLMLLCAATTKAEWARASQNEQSILLEPPTSSAAEPDES
ncbi:hypothetical protein BGZ79_007047 [Entomortierella chlamydospora]|nr:hypothetical protein BGZ79_007047 [Entomortierella chlamydospora]